MKRVVITGIGACTPVGHGKDEFWNAVKSGVCGIGRVTRFDASDYTCQVAAEVKGLNPDLYIDKKESKRMDLFSIYAMLSAKMAVADSALNDDDIDKERMGVILGCGIGGMTYLENQHNILLEKGPGRVSPFFIPMMISNIAPGLIAIDTGAKGPCFSVSSACSSGADAIGQSFRIIGRGDADIMVTGGTEATITPLSFAGFCSMKAMSTRNENPKEACTPFDLNRDGFVMGEGSGVIILEELEHAKKRGATIYAEIVGYANTNDAFHITAPATGGEGGARAMANAIADAKITPDQIDYINAHGTSTPYNDKYETEAIKTVLGEHAYKVAVSSTKSMTGHMLGAAGAIESIISALAVNEGFIPATIGYKTPDPVCDLDIVPHKGRKQEIRYVMSNSLGFGGHNASLIFKKYE